MEQRRGMPKETNNEGEEWETRVRGRVRREANRKDGG